MAAELEPEEAKPEADDLENLVLDDVQGMACGGLEALATDHRRLPARCLEDAAVRLAQVPRGRPRGAQAARPASRGQERGEKGKSHGRTTGGAPVASSPTTSAHERRSPRATSAVARAIAPVTDIVREEATATPSRPRSWAMTTATASKTCKRRVVPLILLATSNGMFAAALWTRRAS